MKHPVDSNEGDIHELVDLGGIKVVKDQERNSPKTQAKDIQNSHSLSIEAI